MLFLLFGDLLNRINIIRFIDVTQDIIHTDNDKKIELFDQNLADLALITYRYIGQVKKHYPILEIPISSPKHTFLFIFFLDFYQIISIGQVELCEAFNLI